jgi:sulfane dehydrogenase subunit SoxC
MTESVHLLQVEVWPIESRCTDETGYVQPSREALVEVLGLNSQFHNNCIMIWKVTPDGGVHNV